MMDAESRKGHPPATALPAGYAELLEDIKERIRSAQIKAALSVNRELVLLYWRIGREILQRQEQEGWGTKVIERLAHDLKREFPEMKGFSPRNLKYMRAFAEAYRDNSFVQQLAAQIPWFHNCVILDKLKNPVAREWYIRQTIEHGWSRNVLVHQIESGLYERQGKAITNRPSACCSAKRGTGSSSSTPSATWASPSASRSGKRDSLVRFPTTCAPACPQLRSWKQN